MEVAKRSKTRRTAGYRRTAWKSGLFLSDGPTAEASADGCQNKRADFAGSELAEDAKTAKNRREKHLNLPKTAFFT